MNENLKIYENTICSGLFNVLPKWSMRRRELKIGVGGGAGSPSVNVRLLRCNVSSHAWVTLYAMNAKNFWCALIKNKQKNQQRNQKIVKWINYHIKIKKSNASKFIHFVIFFFSQPSTSGKKGRK